MRNIIAAAILALFLVTASIPSYLSILGGSVNAVIGTSFTAENANITKVDAELEQALREKIDRTSTDFPGYDGYKFNLDEIGHDSFELDRRNTCRCSAIDRFRHLTVPIFIQFNKEQQRA